MSWTTQKIEVKKLSPSLIDEFVTMKRLPNDRDLRSKRIAFLKGEVEQGRFRTCEWASVFVKETNEIFRVNGKHTATLFSQLDKVPSVSVVVERYECDTLADAAKLYSTFDSKQSSRTAHDVNSAFIPAVPELQELHSQIVDKCVSGMSFAIHELSYSAETLLDRAERILTEHQFILWASQFVGSGGGSSHKAHLTRSPVIAAMYRTYLKDYEGAQQFWSLVRDETGPSGCSSRKLARYLLIAKMRNVGQLNGRAKSAIVSGLVGMREVFVKCLHAWNAWCRGESTELKYYADKVTPTVVDRTYKGRKERSSKRD